MIHPLLVRAAAVSALLAATAVAQDYPNKAVRVIVPWAAGGSTDSIGGSPDEFVAYNRIESAQWGKVIREQGIKIE